MPLSDGDPADDGDVWFRIVTQEAHLVRGRVHHSAFGGSAIAPPDEIKNRAWDREMSGRLRSLAGSRDDIKTHAEHYCEALTARGGGTKKFSGLMYVRVGDAKKNYADVSRTGVHFTPLSNDDAHADLTFYGWIGSAREDRERFYLWLTDILQALHHPGQLQYLPEAERSIVERLLDQLRSIVPKRKPIDS